MIADILTVMWKEKKGLFRERGGRTKTVLTIMAPVVILGIFLPWQEGRGWLEGFWSLIGCIIIPLFLVGTTIPDSFAGERERHTLETLLASRLSDRAILFGKVAMAIGYAWGTTLVLLLLALVTVNVTHWDGGLLLYSPTIALADVALSLLLAILMAGLGVLISLRAATAQGAQQTLMIAVMVPLMLLQIAGVLVVEMLTKEGLTELFSVVNLTQILLIVMAVLVVVDLGLLVAAMARFQRARLILG